MGDKSLKYAIIIVGNCNNIDFVPRNEEHLPFDFRDLNSFVSKIDDEMFASGALTEEEEF